MTVWGGYISKYGFKVPNEVKKNKRIFLKKQFKTVLHNIALLGSLTLLLPRSYLFITVLRFILPGIN